MPEKIAQQKVVCLKGLNSQIRNVKTDLDRHGGAPNTGVTPVNVNVSCVNAPQDSTKHSTADTAIILFSPSVRVCVFVRRVNVHTVNHDVANGPIAERGRCNRVKYHRREQERYTERARLVKNPVAASTHL